MQNQDFIKQITSKDINLSKKIIKEIIDNKNIALFQELCEKSDFIFPFLKTRIIKDFISFINKDNFDITFLFAKVYNCDFEEIILTPWLNFANEDLTDKILVLLEKGTDDEKCYAARYFGFIQDSLALDTLYKEAFSNNQTLSQISAETLKKYKDEKIIEISKNVILKSNDDFEKLKAFQILIIFNKFEYVLQNCFDNLLCSSIIATINDFWDFEYLKKNIEASYIYKIFNVLIENYPEVIPLDTISYWGVLDYIRFLANENSPYANNLLIIAKDKMNEFNSIESYNYELDKNTKQYLKDICAFLNNLNLEIKNEDISLIKDKMEFSALLCAIKILKDEKYCSQLANLVNENKLDNVLGAKTAALLKEFNKIDLLDKSNIEKIQEPNARALILSYFN